MAICADKKSPHAAHEFFDPRDEGEESEPAISPDGRMIAFTASYDSNNDGHPHYAVAGGATSGCTGSE